MASTFRSVTIFPHSPGAGRVSGTLTLTMPGSAPEGGSCAVAGSLPVSRQAAGCVVSAAGGAGLPLALLVTFLAARSPELRP
jgi:hypothetical protein